MDKSKPPSATPRRVGILYCLLLIMAMLVAVAFIGTKAILMSAMASKPYSVLLHSAQFFSLVTEYHESEEQSKGQELKVICFGDSNSFYPPDTIVPHIGNRKIHLAGLLQEALEESQPGTSVYFSEWAYGGATMFDYYCLFYEAERFSPDLIIVPINWITFGSAWTEDLSPYRPELSALVPLRSELPSSYEDPLKADGISPINQLEYRIDLYMLYPIGIKFWVVERLRSVFHSQVAQDITEVSPTGAATFSGEPEDESRQLGGNEFRPWGTSADQYFPMKIEKSHPVLREMRALAYIASKHGTKLLFYIWPLDTDFLDETGVLDRSSLEQSKKLIKEAAREQNVYLVDLSETLTHKYFFDRRAHCNIEGRRKVAHLLLPEIMDILNLTPGEESAVSEDTKASAL